MSAVVLDIDDGFSYPIFEQQIADGAEELELRVSHSSMSSYTSCARKFEFGKLYLYSRQDEDEDEGNLPGEVGHALHTGYQSWIVDKDEEKAIAEMMLRYPIHLNDNPMNPRSIESCLGTFYNMIQLPAMAEYEIAEVKKRNGEIVPAVEVPFEIHISGYYLSYKGYKVRVIYTGFIDLVCWSNLSRKYSVTDIKTTRDKTIDQTAKYRFDTQTLPYGVIVSQLVGQDIQELDVNYMSVYVDVAEPRSQLYEFKRDKNDLADFGKNLIFMLRNLQDYINAGWFPRSTNACMNFFRPCRYFEACHYRRNESIIHFMDTNNKTEVREIPEPWIKIDLELAS